jgi:hypothetical protein
VSVKLGLKWSKPMVIAKFFKPNVVLLANANTGVGVKKAQVSIKRITPGWELSGSRQVMAGEKVTSRSLEPLRGEYLNCTCPHSSCMRQLLHHPLE